MSSFFIACTAVLALTSQQAARPSDAELATALGALVDSLEKSGAAGHLLVARGEERLFARGFGLAERETKRPWTADTLATVGSITKQFTAAAVLKLVEQKKLTALDMLAQHFPDVPADKAAITLRQLLTHTSGLHDLTQELRDSDWIARDDFVQSVLEAPLEFEPGARYEYNNSGFSLLAAIVERVSGTDFASFLRRELFEPAGLTDTGYLPRDFERARLAVGYRRGERWGDILSNIYTDEGPSWVVIGNGEVFSSASQMQRWALALLDGKVLAPASLAELWQPRVDESNGQKLSYYGYGWALFDVAGHQVITHNGGNVGWALFDVAGHQVITHNGGNGIFFADLALVREERLILFLQTNAKGDFPRAERLLFEILRFALSGERLPD